MIRINVTLAPDPGHPEQWTATCATLDITAAGMTPSEAVAALGAAIRLVVDREARKCEITSEEAFGKIAEESSAPPDPRVTEISHLLRALHERDGEIAVLRREQAALIKALGEALPDSPEVVHAVVLEEFTTALTTRKFRGALGQELEQIAMDVAESVALRLGNGEVVP